MPGFFVLVRLRVPHSGAEKEGHFPGELRNDKPHVDREQAHRRKVEGAGPGGFGWRRLTVKNLAFLFVLFVNATAVATDPEPLLKSAPMAFYPAIARMARIEGKVTLRAKIDQDGNVGALEAFTGHPLLKEAALANVKGWKFGWPSPCFCTVTKEITFVYRMSGKEETGKSSTVTVKWFGTARVEIETDAPQINVTNSY